MPKLSQRTRGVRKRFVRTTSGKTTIHYKGRKAGPASCASCGRPLSGVPRDQNRLRTLPRSSRRPNRAFGGKFCSSCSRRALKESVRE